MLKVEFLAILLILAASAGIAIYRIWCLDFPGALYSLIGGAVLGEFCRSNSA